MKLRVVVVAALWAGITVVSGCSPKPGESEHQHENWSVTAWGEQYEIFVECEPLIAGVMAKCHTHVTVLADFSAFRSGTVSAVLRDYGGREEVFLQPTPVRDGIFSVEITPSTSAGFALSFRVEGSAGTETIASGRVYVGTADTPGGIIEVPVYSLANRSAGGGLAVSFLKEQQWRTPFHTVWAEGGVIQVAVRGPARARPAAGAEAILTAPLDGVVDAGARLYTGLGVQKGSVLLRLAPRAASNQTLAELEAEGDVAAQRLARLEELLELEAVSRAEVEAARARVATIETQLGAARGRGGAGAPVIAPFAGEIAEVHVIPGQAVSAGDALVRVVRRTPLWFEVSLLPTEAARLVRAPAGCVISASGAPPVQLPSSQVRIVSVSPEVDPSTGKVTAILEVTEALPVQLGTIADAEILLDEKHAGIVIPFSAIVDDAGTPVVYVQDGGESFARRPIEILGRQAHRVLVSGVAAGERVVSIGGGTIRRQALMSTGPVEGHVH